MNISDKIQQLNTRKYPFTPDIGWSVSRAAVFNTCKRKYYYQYYTKHVWDGDELARVATLRSMLILRMECGTIVHQIIASVLEQSIRSRVVLKWQDVADGALI